MADYEKMADSELFKLYAETKDIEVRNILLERYLYVAQIAAKKFTGRGVDYEDLLQIASLALVKVIDRFDPSRDIKFTSFATPSLIGEIKNYFRDSARVLRVPRRDGELIKKMNAAIAEYSAENGRAPTTKQLAQELGVTPEKIFELMEMKNAGNLVSLDGVQGGDGEEFDLLELLGSDDGGFERLENADFLKYCLSQLTEEERRIISLRFISGKTQKEVADITGVSQMQVSRLERRILEKLRKKV